MAEVGAEGVATADAVGVVIGLVWRWHGGAACMVGSPLVGDDSVTSEEL